MSTRPQQAAFVPTARAPREPVGKTNLYNNFMPPPYAFGSPEFDEAVHAAGRQAFEEARAAGLPVFYRDAAGMKIMEQAGRRFEIRWLPDSPSGELYEIVRELTAHAA